MKQSESRRFTFFIAVYCVAFTVILCALYFLYRAVCPPRTDAVMQMADAAAAGKPQVILDAGHGGRDGGAVGVTGLIEKDLNLEIAVLLDDMLRAAGVTTRMTRSVDSLVCDETDPALHGRLKQTDLKNRVALAEANPDALFVSIHMNNFPVEKYHGLQVYYSPHAENSRTLAACIQENTAALLQPDNTRKIKPAGSNIFLLNRIRTTAVLVECGFISNRAESANLTDDGYRKQIALVLVASLLQNLYKQP